LSYGPKGLGNVAAFEFLHGYRVFRGAVQSRTA